MDTLLERMHAGLVLVRAKDGSEWWVQPEAAERYAQMESAYVPLPDEYRTARQKLRTS